MFATKKINKRTIIILLLIPVIIILLYTAEKITSGKSDTKTAGVSLNASSPDDMIAFLEKYGWKTEASPQEVCDITLPAEFDEVYKKYNELQKTQDFDLLPYAGKTVKRYSFVVTNYPEVDETIRANILVCDEKIIGGDLCSARLNGFMHGFKMTGTGITEQTIYQTTSQILSPASQ